MSILHPTPVSSDQFTWLPDKRLFVAEISDFGRTFQFGRVYDDACDTGFTLISARKPGQEIVFTVYREVRDDEGDVRYWDMIPANGKPAPFGVIVYND